MNLLQRALNAAQNAAYKLTHPAQGETLRAPLNATFGVWQPVAQGRKSVTYQDVSQTNKFALDVTQVDLHYESAPGSGNYDTPVSINIERVITPSLDGWLANVAGYHYALGQPGGKVTDGWVGYGGRGGQHWLLTRLVRAGYLHWPTRTWDDVSGAPNYARANLALAAPQTLTLPTLGTAYTVSQQATWGSVWTTPGGGRLDVRWRVDGGRLKEEIILNQAARTWITNNHPPTTPLTETWFGFVFQLDIAGVHQFLKNGVWQDMTGDWEDEGTYGVEMRNQLGDLIGFLPIGHGGVVSGGLLVAEFGLRRRFWLDPDGNLYLLLGVRCDTLAGLPNGTLGFDPTIDQQVTGSAHDAEELNNGTGFTATSTTIEARSSTNAALIKNAGIYFPLTGGPAQGDTIDVAYIYTRCGNAARDSVHCDLYFHDADSTADFSADADVTSRPRTTAFVAYNQDNQGSGTVNSPSLVAPAQEVVDRPGWDAAALTVLPTGRNDTSQPGERWTPDSYDGAPATAPGFHMEWTAAVTPSTARLLPLQGAGT